MCAGAVALPVPSPCNYPVPIGSGIGLGSGVSDRRIGAPDSDAARPVDVPGPPVLVPARSRRSAAGPAQGYVLASSARVMDENPNTPPDGLAGDIPEHGRRRRRNAVAHSLALP